VHFSEVRVIALKDRTGKSPTTSDVALINYVGRIASTGKEFDRGENAAMPLQGVIPGFAQGLQQMKVGGKYRLEIPAALAYGSQAMPGRDGVSPSPPTATWCSRSNCSNSAPWPSFSASRPRCRPCSSRCRRRRGGAAVRAGAGGGPGGSGQLIWIGCAWGLGPGAPASTA
jgi:FKBP-type peptidyl-prolyl cis-trans isomerase FkpA